MELVISPESSADCLRDPFKFIKKIRKARIAKSAFSRMGIVVWIFSSSEQFRQPR